MQEVFEKIVTEIERRKVGIADNSEGKWFKTGLDIGISIIKEVAVEYNNGWIPVSERLPKAEEEVFILTAEGKKTTAMYEDGTILTGESVWNWHDCDFEYDEIADDYIISEGWWEYRHFNPDEVYNNIVDEEVIAWQPLPDSYQSRICADKGCPYNKGTECPAEVGCAGYEEPEWKNHLMNRFMKGE